MFSHLKQDRPDIACIKCSCHMIHLAASKACLKLPKSVEDMLSYVGAYFGRSFARQKTLKKFQEFYHVDIHKILSPANTRWLSVKACVDRVLEQFVPLQAYFKEASKEDPSHTLNMVLDTMENNFTPAYLEFMSYVLGILCGFNKMFQAEKPLLHKN